MPSVFTPSDTSIDKFHFGLNVASLQRSVDFYSLFFGLPPCKFLDDYAKFELRDPPLVMSLLPNSQLRGGTLSHLGLRMPDGAALVDMQRRLEEGGVRTEREDGVECCYARQTKFWVTDPDLNLWEVYVVAGDLQYHGIDLPPRVVEPPVAAAAIKKIWEHRLTQPLPDRIPHETATLDEVRLEGTFGHERTPQELEALWHEVWRVLRPGGKVHVHNLVASWQFANGVPTLPGPAAVIKHVPLENEILHDLERIGFQGVKYDKLGDQPCFTFEGVEMREMRLSGTKTSVASPGGRQRTVIYRGPFERVTDDAGNVYTRGERQTVADEWWQSLEDAAFLNQFETIA
ncbi:MAG TPA: ArsI/CadI family heavy metal resistance metalloenzyme [Pirellulales bacterium]|nr:ArsI/CadI family heavy metal resistance metalloenzyme [Pirellulales bacterium]